MVGAQIDNETRVAILQALSEASSSSMSYSSLREAVGIDDKGLFNYHLDILVDRFVEKSDGEYKLEPIGELVVESMESGIFGQTESIDPIPIGSSCSECETSLEVRYENNRATVGCSDCSKELYLVFAWPGLLWDYERNRLPFIIDRHRRIDLAIAFTELCLRCNGELETQPTLHNERPQVQQVCRLCDHVSRYSYGEFLMIHPLVAGFCYDNDIDIWQTPSWQLEWIRTDPTQIISADPLRVQVSFITESATLTLEVDEELSLVENRRRPSD